MIAILLFFVLVASPSWAATLYSSPTGSGSTCSSASPCTNSTALGLLAPGDTLLVADGTYTGTSQMFTWSGTLSNNVCTATKGGTAVAPITIKAVNDGAAIIDGQVARAPLRWTCVQYVIVEGLRFQNSNVNVVFLISSSHNTFRRISVYNGNYYPAPDTAACPGVPYYNYHTMQVYNNSDYVMVEDSIFGGAGRNMITYYTSKFGIFQRNVLIGGGYTAGTVIPGGCTSFRGDNHGEPIQVYGSSDTVIANVISIGLGEWSGHLRFLQAGFNIWANTGQQAHRNKYLGTIVMNYPGYGYFVSSFCNSTQAAECITDNLFENVVSYKNGWGAYIQNGINTTVNYATLAAGTQGEGGTGSYKDGLLFAQVRDPAKVSSYLVKNALIINNDYACTATSDVQAGDAVINYALLYGNVGLYDALCTSQVTKTNITTGVDPAVDSIAYVKAGSPAITAGEGGGQVGADTRCRYISSYSGTGIVTVHTTESLWPLPSFINQRTIDETLQIHGVSYDPNAIVLDALGPRDTANLGCPAGNPPPSPSSYASSTGTSSASYSHNIDAGTTRLLACVALYDDGQNVGSVSSITSGGESLSLLASGRVVTSPGYRAVEVWGLANPTSGNRTISLATTGAVDQVAVTTIALPDSASLRAVASTSGLGVSPAVTATAANGDTIYDCLANSSSATATPGADQTQQASTAHATAGTVRLSVSTQAGSDGGLMSETLSSNNYYAYAAVASVPGSPPPPTTPTWTLSKYRIASLYGVPGSAETPIFSTAVNTPGTIANGGAGRIRTEIAVGGADSTAISAALYCRTDANPYAEIRGQFNGNPLRLIGNDSYATIPNPQTPTTQQLGSGSFTAGVVVRREEDATIINAMANGGVTEHEWLVDVDPTLAPGTAIDCEVRSGDGVTISYPVRPAITIVTPNVAAP